MLNGSDQSDQHPGRSGRASEVADLYSSRRRRGMSPAESVPLRYSRRFRIAKSSHGRPSRRLHERCATLIHVTSDAVLHDTGCFTREMRHPGIERARSDIHNSAMSAIWRPVQAASGATRDRVASSRSAWMAADRSGSMPPEAEPPVEEATAEFGRPGKLAASVGDHHAPGSAAPRDASRRAPPATGWYVTTARWRAAGAFSWKI